MKHMDAILRKEIFDWPNETCAMNEPCILMNESSNSVNSREWNLRSE